MTAEKIPTNNVERAATYKFMRARNASTSSHSVFMAVSQDDTFTYATGIKLEYLTEGHYHEDVVRLSTNNAGELSKDVAVTLLRKFTQRPVTSLINLPYGWDFILGETGKDKDVIDTPRTFEEEQLDKIHARGDIVCAMFNDPTDSVNTFWLNMDRDTFHEIKKLIVSYAESLPQEG